MKNIRQDILAHTKTILIKVGSAVLTGNDGLDLNIINSLVRDMSNFVKKGYSVVLVTSGAIVSVKHRFNITDKLKSIP
jgi:glutamate 5-kinase